MEQPDGVATAANAGQQQSGNAPPVKDLSGTSRPITAENREPRADRMRPQTEPNRK